MFRSAQPCIAEGPGQGKVIADGLVYWYCPPEVLLSSALTQQDGHSAPSADIDWSKADMWAVGCMLGELLTRKLLFPSNGTPQDQLRSILRILTSLLRADQGVETGQTKVGVSRACIQCCCTC